MERRNFLSTGILGGITLLNFPTSTLAQKNKNKEPINPFYIPPTEPLTPGPGNVEELGCDLTDQGYIKVDNLMRTTV